MSSSKRALHILESLHGLKPVSRVQLQQQFGDSVKRTIDFLKQDGLLETELVQTGQVMVSITKKGEEVVKEFSFCEACECNPCDCGWGN